jgi:hypothetical protein
MPRKGEEVLCHESFQRGGRSGEGAGEGVLVAKCLRNLLKGSARWEANTFPLKIYQRIHLALEEDFTLLSLVVHPTRQRRSN